MRRRDSDGSAERAKGSVKEAIGKLTGDPRVEAEGRAQKRSEKTVSTSGETSGTRRGS